MSLSAAWTAILIADFLGLPRINRDSRRPPGFNKISAAAIRPLLELVTSPESPVVEIASRLCLFEEPSRIEDSVVGLEPEMTIRLPTQFGAGAVPDESRAAIVRRPDEESWNSIDSVFKTLPPLDNPVEGDGHVFGKGSFDVRMNINKVDRPRTSRGQHSKVVPLGKQRIERSQRIRAWVVSA